MPVIIGHVKHAKGVPNAAARAAAVAELPPEMFTAPKPADVVRASGGAPAPQKKAGGFSLKDHTAAQEWWILGGAVVGLGALGWLGWRMMHRKGR